MREGAVYGVELSLPLQARAWVAEGVAARYRQLARALSRDRRRLCRRLHEEPGRGELLYVYLFIADLIASAGGGQGDVPRPRRRVGRNVEPRGEYALFRELRAHSLPEFAVGREDLHRQREWLGGPAVGPAHYRLYRQSLAGAEDVPRRVAEGRITAVQPGTAGGVKIVVAVVEPLFKADIGGVPVLLGKRDDRRAPFIGVLERYFRDAAPVRLSLADELVRVRPECHAHAGQRLGLRDGEHARERRSAAEFHGEAEVRHVYRLAAFAPHPAAASLRHDEEDALAPLEQRLEVQRAARRFIRFRLYQIFLLRDEARELRRVALPLIAHRDGDVVVVKLPEEDVYLVEVDALQRYP